MSNINGDDYWIYNVGSGSILEAKDGTLKMLFPTEEEAIEALNDLRQLNNEDREPDE